ncbi:uncharacterized protein RJT21DRAFT_58856 [Scheffersomyces amazonensis]|uniref:uncharacterized protein n=1 Tax=Scheffersomyces amazonensis TaxID=1078765 RepID=UPI00315D6422
MQIIILPSLSKFSILLIMSLFVQSSNAFIDSPSLITFQKRQVERQFQDLEYFKKIIDFLSSGNGNGTEVSIENGNNDLNFDQSVFDAYGVNTEDNLEINSDSNVVVDHHPNILDSLNELSEYETNHDTQTENIILNNGNVETPGTIDDLLQNVTAASSCEDEPKKKPSVQVGVGIYFEKKVKVEEEKEEEDDCEPTKKKKWSKFFPFNVATNVSRTSDASFPGRLHINSTFLVSPASIGSHNLFKSTTFEEESQIVTNSSHYYHDNQLQVPKKIQFNETTKRRKSILKKARKSSNDTLSNHNYTETTTAFIQDIHDSSSCKIHDLLYLSRAYFLVCFGFIIYLLY